MNAAHLALDVFYFVVFVIGCVITMRREKRLSAAYKEIARLERMLQAIGAARDSRLSGRS